MATKPVVDVSSRPAQAVLSLPRGDQWIRTLSFRQGSATGDPLDLTGAELSAAIYRTLGGEKIDDLAITVVSPATAGQAVIDLPEAVSSQLNASSYSNDSSGVYWIVIKMVDTLEITRTLLQIKTTITQGV